MSYNSILAVLTGAPDDDVTLNVAAQFVGAQGGEVKAVLALPTVSTVLMSGGLAGGFISEEIIDIIQQGNSDARRKTSALIQQISERANLSLAGSGARILLLPEQATGEFDMLGETPLCDLLIIAQSTFKSLGLWSGLVSGALLRAQLPFYIVRRGAPEHSVAAIAWDGSQSAGRAVRGALPLLTAASKVVLVQDPDHISATHRVAANLNSLSAYLKLHGVKNIRVLSQAGVSRSGGLGAAARQAHADVLIAGAFGHARAMEALFGGATDDLLQPAGYCNLLLAH